MERFKNIDIIRNRLWLAIFDWIYFQSCFFTIDIQWRFDWMRCSRPWSKCFLSCLIVYYAWLAILQQTILIFFLIKFVFKFQECSFLNKSPGIYPGRYQHCFGNVIPLTDCTENVEGYNEVWCTAHINSLRIDIFLALKQKIQAKFTFAWIFQHSAWGELLIKSDAKHIQIQPK